MGFVRVMNPRDLRARPVPLGHCQLSKALAGYVRVRPLMILMIILVLTLPWVTSCCKDRTIWELTEERALLVETIGSLAEDRVEGHISVQRQVLDEKGRKVSHIKFWVTSPLKPRHRDPLLVKELEVIGSELHINALVVQVPIAGAVAKVKTGEDSVKEFAEPIVEGKTAALVLWHRIFGGRVAPETVASLDFYSEAGTPERYHKALQPVLWKKHISQFWQDVFRLREDPAFLEQFGVASVSGQGAYTDSGSFRAGQYYQVLINQMNGRLTIKPMVPPEAFPEGDLLEGAAVLSVQKETPTTPIGMEE